MEYTGIVEILPVAFQEAGITRIKFPSNSAGRLDRGAIQVPRILQTGDDSFGSNIKHAFVS